MSAEDDWLDWCVQLRQCRHAGREDAERGIVEYPCDGDTDPQDQDMNKAYKDGFFERRRELGDKFKWA